MNWTRVCAATACLAMSFFVASISSAETKFLRAEGSISGYATSASQDAFGFITDFQPVTPFQIIEKDELPFDPNGPPASLISASVGVFDNDGLNFSNAKADGNYNVNGSFGVVHAFIGGSVGTNNINQVAPFHFPGIAEYGEARVSVSASMMWSDLLKFDVPGQPDKFGTLIDVHGNLELHGSVKAESPPANGNSNISLILEGTGIENSGMIIASDNGFATQFQAPVTVPVEYQTVVGGPQDMFVKFTLSGQSAGAATQQNGKFTTFFVGEYSGTLTWGGITSVTDQLGNPLDGWTVTSASGFDYSKPFPVPEPASMLVLGQAAFLILAVRREC